MRHAIVLFITIILMGVTMSAQATPLTVLKELADALGAAGDAAGKIANGFGELAREGTKGYDEIKARQIHRRLVDLHVRLVHLTESQNALAIRTLEDYARRPEPRSWPGVIQRLDDLLGKVVPLLDDVKSERSDFVLEDTYRVLNTSLQGRIDLLTSLKALPPPSTADEIAEMQRAAQQYRYLQSQLQEADAALVRYLRN